MFWNKNAKRLVKTLSRASTQEQQVITEMLGHVEGGLAFMFFTFGDEVGQINAY